MLWCASTVGTPPQASKYGASATVSRWTKSGRDGLAHLVTDQLQVPFEQQSEDGFVFNDEYFGFHLNCFPPRAVEQVLTMTGCDVGWGLMRAFLDQHLYDGLGVGDDAGHCFFSLALAITSMIAGSISSGVTGLTR